MLMPDLEAPTDEELAELEDVSAKAEQARELYETFRGRRDSLIVAFRERGAPTDSLQGRTKLSHQRISQILKARERANA